MACFSAINLNFNITPPPAQDTNVQVMLDSTFLALNGLNIPITIAMPSLMCAPPMSLDKKALTVMAHFDTGASITSIDNSIASHLGLIQIGKIKTHTANGEVESLRYFADLSFPNTGLAPFTNTQINSVKLPFRLNPSDPDFISNTNFGLLIGRDLMSCWSIFWNGPSSSVFISD